MSRLPIPQSDPPVDSAEGESLGMPSGLYGEAVGTPMMPWSYAQADQAQQGQNIDQYLEDNPPFDFHEDPEALGAILPESPALPAHRDRTHPMHDTKLGKLRRAAQYAIVGGLAGSAGGNVGQGFAYGQNAIANLQALQMQRDQAKQMAAYHDAQIQRMNAQTAGLPQQQADMSAYRTARTEYLKAQSAKLKRAPNDKFVHSYQGADGRMRLIFQKPGGGTYEQASDQPFYSKPDKPPAAPRPLLGHGPDGGVYLIDPTTGHSRLVIRGKDPNAPKKRASAEYFRKVDNWKSNEWRKATNDSMLSDDERMQRLQDIQDHYERAIVTGGGDVNHYDVRTGGFSQPGTNSTDPNDPWKLR